MFVFAEDAEPARVSDHLAAAKFLGERLRELRHRHGLTQEQAAALCSMEYKYYQMVEWGRMNLRLDTMAQLASAYHLEIWDLVQQAGLPASRIKRFPKLSRHRIGQCGHADVREAATDPDSSCFCTEISVVAQFAELP